MVDDVTPDAAKSGTGAVVSETASVKAVSRKTAGSVETRPVRKARPVATPEIAEVAPAIPAPIDKASAKQADVKETAITPTPVETATQPEQPAAATPVPTATAPKKEYRTMTDSPAIEYTDKVQTAIKSASEKAKAAFEKSQASMGEISEFTKGNVEALVASGKILASGLQAMSKDYLSGSKTAFETLTAELKELAAVKTPSDLLEKQSMLLRKHFDAAVATSSKNSEAMLKLANEAFQPISNRVSLAVEKVKTAA